MTVAQANGTADTVTQSTIRVLLSYIATAGFTAVLTFYLVRALGPRDFGVFSLAIGIGSLLALPADFGIAASATRFIAEKRGNPAAVAMIFASATRLKLAVAGAVAVLTVALAGPIADAYGEPTLAWPLRAMALAVFGQSVMGLFSGVFIAMARTSLNLRVVVSESMVECGATILLVVLTGGAAAAAWGRALGYVVGAVLGFALAVRLLGARAGAVHRRGGNMAALGRYAGALMVVNGAYLLFSNIDLLLIGAILSTTAVGAFSAPLRLAGLLQYPGLALANAIAPLVARSPGREPDFAAVQQGLRLLIIIGAALTVPVLTWTKPITTLLLGDDYRGSIPVLRAMTPFLFLQGLAILLSLSVNYLGEARRRIPVALTAVAVNALIDVVLLEPLGVVAAAVGTSVAFAIYTGGHYRICRPLMELRTRPLLLTTARSAAAGAAMATVLLLFGTDRLSALQWLGGGLGGCLAFAAVILASGEVDRKEVAAMLRRSG